MQKVEIDSFSGYRIYASKGRLFVRGDSKVASPAIFKTPCVLTALFPDIPVLHLQE